MRILKPTCLTCVLLCFVSPEAIADNVEVYLENDWTFVEGDNRSNDLEIQKVYGAVHMARGLGGTTVNGQSGWVMFGVPHSMTISMNGGSDTVNIRSLQVRGSSSANLFIDMGTGDNDLVLRAASVRRDVEIENVGSGEIVVDGLRARDLSINGSATDFALVQSCTLNSILISDVREAAVNHNDADEAYLHHSGILRMYGNDLFWVDIQGTDASDKVDFVSNHITGNAIIEARDGDDSLRVQHNTFGLISFLTVDGGRGNDTGLVRKSWWWDPIKIFDFEGRQ